jgi:hypothetical protein
VRCHPGFESSSLASRYYCLNKRPCIRLAACRCLPQAFGRMATLR